MSPTACISGGVVGPSGLSWNIMCSTTCARPAFPADPPSSQPRTGCPTSTSWRARIGHQHEREPVGFELAAALAVLERELPVPSGVHAETEHGARRPPTGLRHGEGFSQSRAVASTRHWPLATLAPRVRRAGVARAHRTVSASPPGNAWASVPPPMDRDRAFFGHPARARNLFFHRALGAFLVLRDASFPDLLPGGPGRARVARECSTR